MNFVRSRILQRSPVYGTFAAIPHPMAVEICALSGHDLICIDWEHSQIDRGGIENLVRAANVHDVPAFIRLPSHAPEHVATALDAGAAGLLVPRVSTARQAREIVSATRYPPLGERGVGPGRASGYGKHLSDKFLNLSNEGICVAVQIETATAVDNIEEIVAVEGIDMFFVGPGDLAVSLGAFGTDKTDRLEQAVKRVALAAANAKRSAGIFTQDVASADAWAKYGFSTFIIGSDASILANALWDRMANRQSPGNKPASSSHRPAHLKG